MLAKFKLGKATGPETESLPERSLRKRPLPVQTDDPSGSPSLSETESHMEHERAIYLALKHDEI